MEIEERDWLYSLNLIEGIGRRTIFGLYRTVSSLKNRSEVTVPLLRTLGISASLCQQITTRLTREQVLADKEERIRSQIQFVSFLDEEFPHALSNIPDPPALLFYKGDFTLLNEPMLAIVGTRKATRYGESVCQYFASGMSKRGMVIISGMALGIDTLAHRFALETGSPTIAVLGCAIDQIYPRQNTSLYQKIVQKGLILSEYPPGTKLHPGMFPERNRIISGLSLGVLVIEAAERSGSLITADHALEQGKEVFAVPGSIFSQASIGPHNLVKQGAKLVTDCQDIVEEFTWLPTKIEASAIFDKESLDSDEQFLLSMISETPVHWDELYMSLDPSVRLSLDPTLVRLQTKKCIEWLPGGYYRRRADQK
ncbi:DNA-processing protein DprA [Brevibacillus ginsengisoli]|uniref:DNA-processing protein DprA n=1 Tax=Brevibacillus ginsengisoli TaxID=363854 RepID=UPI003CF55483